MSETKFTKGDWISVEDRLPKMANFFGVKVSEFIGAGENE